jgi:hypothetical protein
MFGSLVTGALAARGRLVPLVVVSLLAPLLLGAQPTEGGPAVGGAPADLLRDSDGERIATLEAGSPLQVLSVACEESGAWVDAAAGDQLGWLRGEQVTWGDGVPLALAGWAEQLAASDRPRGPTRWMLDRDISARAVGMFCDDHRPWLEVAAGAQRGWVFAPSTYFPPPRAEPAAAPAEQASGPVAAGVQGAPIPPADSPEYGMNVFVWDRPEAAAQLAQVRALRFGWVKTLIRWRDVEGVGKGQYDWSRADALVKAAADAGLKVLARVDFQPDWARGDHADNGPPDNVQDYADFVGALVARYGSSSPYGRVQAVEVWNEPNLTKTWGDEPVNRRQASDYVRLLAAAHDAARAVDPSVVVVSASLSSTGTNNGRARPDDLYLQWLYDAGLKDACDAVGIHGPGYKAPPELSPEEALANPFWGGDRSFTFRRVEDLRGIMERNGDAGKQAWVTEFGWTSDPVNRGYEWARVSEEQKGDYLVRALYWARLHWRPWVGPMFVWTMPDPTWGPHDEKYWWAIADPDGTPRPAYQALLDARGNGTLP